MMLTWVRNAHLMHPHDRGCHDLLLGGGKILALAPTLDRPPWSHIEIDAEGRTTVPALIDRHIHLCGGGGEQGFASRTPAIHLHRLLLSGIGTAIGVLGTDGVTRQVADLYAKAAALEEEGISTFIYTGSYALPSPTISGSLRNDLTFIDKVVGLKLALADSRASYPQLPELLRLANQVRVAGMIRGLVGAFHVHVGADEIGIADLLSMIERHHFPAQHLQPTHMGRHRRLLDQAVRLAQLGGFVDLTTGGTSWQPVWQSLRYLLDRGAPLSQLTLSSDANGSLPRFNPKGEVVGLGMGHPGRNLQVLADLHQQAGLSIGEAISLMTSHVATAIGLRHKGQLEPGYDADLLMLDQQWRVSQMFCRGVLAVDQGVPQLKGRFDED